MKLTKIGLLSVIFLGAAALGGCVAETPVDLAGEQRDTLAAEPTGCCPPAFDRLTVEYVVDNLAAEGYEDAIRTMDKNGDDYLCVRVLEGGPPQFDPAFVYRDDNSACP